MTDEERQQRPTLRPELVEIVDSATAHLVPDDVSTDLRQSVLDLLGEDDES